MSRHKKILHIVEAFGGGVFTYLVDLVNATDREFDIVIAYGIREETFENFEKYFSNRVKFIQIKNFTRGINPIKDLKALLEIRKVVKSEKPDIVHLHSSKAGFLGRFAVSSTKYKILYNPHGYSFLMKDCSTLKRKIYWLLEKIGTIKKCTIVACSQGEHAETLKLTSNAICINNGININKLKNDTKELKEKQINLSDIKICTVGRIGYQKNPELFDKIATKLPNTEFTWIGDGELKENLTSTNIKITGWKERKEVLEELNKNDIFILTSLWEGLPISLLEAMYMKKICIVSNVLGNRDVIKNAENGFVCNDEDEFIKTIGNIANNEYKYEEIQNNAYNDVLKHYNIDIMCKKYIELYKSEK